MNKTIVIIITFLLSLATLTYLYNSNRKLKAELIEQQSNVEALLTASTQREEENRMLKLSINQLKTSNDSISNKLLQSIKKLKIKEKDIEQLNYRLSTIKKTDTLYIRDTLFLDPSLNIDTTFGDEWMIYELGLKYPNEISINPTIKLENTIIVKETKTTVNPRKKFFLSRWFQKKKKIREVIVIENNPYVIDSVSRFIEVIK